MSDAEPGRTCPLSYRTRPEDLAGAVDLSADTLYLVGGLYGNEQALEAIEALADAERRQGLPEPVLVFNGDFNWFNAEPRILAELNDRVLRHWALQGNVEAELADPDPSAGCGCAYPEWVDDATVERSNRIIEALKTALGDNDTLRRALGEQPKQLAARVGAHRIGLIHGDPESLAGWDLAVERMPPPGEADGRIMDWFERADVSVFACTHTCLPFLQAFEGDTGAGFVINNGSAGMPNFRGSRDGLISRISVHPSPHDSVYGTHRQGLHLDALGVTAVTQDWLKWFEQRWPAGSPAHQSYFERLTSGPDYQLGQARRFVRK